MLIRDIRGEESSYTLDTHSFEVHHISNKERDMMNEELVRSEYFDEIADLIKRA
jgi:hypothetical protein